MTRGLFVVLFVVVVVVIASSPGARGISNTTIATHIRVGYLKKVRIGSVSSDSITALRLQNFTASP
jgi:hypothetical protein